MAPEPFPCLQAWLRALAEQRNCLRLTGQFFAGCLSCWLPNGLHGVCPCCLAGWDISAMINLLKILNPVQQGKGDKSLPKSTQLGLFCWQKRWLLGKDQEQQQLRQRHGHDKVTESHWACHREMKI